MTPLFARVAYLQGVRQPLLGPTELLRTYPSKLPLIL